MLRRLTALVALAAMLVLPPVALTAIGFRSWATLDLLRPVDVSIVLATLTVIGWVAWVLWVVSVAVEAVALLRRPPRLPRLRALSAPRALASTLLGVVLASAVGGGAHAEPARDAAAAVSAPTSPREAAPAGELASVASPEPAVDATATAAPVRHHVVRASDDLWSIAREHYGSGETWRLIAEANPEVLADPLVDLQAGTRLNIPPTPQVVTVARGDTLSELAETHLGDAARWPEIHEMNRDVVADPDVIDVGWQLRVPAGEGPGTTTDASTSDTEPDAPADEGSRGNAAGASASTSAGPVSASPAAPAVPAPADGEGEHATQTPAPASDAEGSEPDAAQAAGLVGGVTALTAAAVLGGLGVRRHVQERTRPLGRRFVQPGEELARYSTALARLAEAPAGEAFDRPHLVARAMRLLSHHWWSVGRTAPDVSAVVLSDTDVTFAFEGGAPALPDAFVARGAEGVVTWDALRRTREPDSCVAYPGLVTLGEDADGRVTMIDAVSSGVVGVRGDGGASASEALSAMLVELSCAPWADELQLAVVTEDARFAQNAGGERVTQLADAESGVAEVERLVAERGRFIAGAEAWNASRLDPDLADAWGPRLVLFEVPPSASQLDRVRRAVEGTRCGVAAILPVDEGAGVATWTITRDDRTRGVLSSMGTPLSPQTVPAATREAISSLYGLADAHDHEEAPWWGPGPTEDDVNIIALRPVPRTLPEAPRIELLGTIRLVGAAGSEPSRAARQCLEYCAWLLEHPGANAVQMSRSLLVAEGTRRSNMSRLRAWLGAAPDGDAFLPDAYSGRIELHPDVSSDWRELQDLVAGGVSRATTERLTLALELVRGAPLADAAPGQWHWAEELRSDVAATVRDIAVVLARRVRERGDLESARWAVNRGLVANPEDELLLAERIRVEAAAGRTDEVHRLVARLNRQARVLGVDLLPETVDLCQEVLEGRLRARQA